MSSSSLFVTALIMPFPNGKWIIDSASHTGSTDLHRHCHQLSWSHEVSPYDKRVITKPLLLSPDVQPEHSQVNLSSLLDFQDLKITHRLQIA
jgi:hypothetical protein